MNLLTMLLAASAIFVPEFSMKDLQFLASKGDSRMDRENLWSAALIELLIAPDGKVADCTVIRFAGDKKAAYRNCNILKQHKFSIPIGPEGKPSFALIPTVLTSYSDRLFPLRQQIASEFYAGLKADKLPTKIEVPMTVFVDGLAPDSVRQGAVLSVATIALPAVYVRIGIDGKVSDCAGNAVTSEALASYACEKATATNFGARTFKGQAVPYLLQLQLFPAS